MSRIIELKWKCRECGQWILGRHKTCPNDGSPREGSEIKNLDGLDSDDYSSDGYNKAATVTDASLLDLATAGADWFCQHCEAGNRGDSDDCTQCGAPRYGVPEENHPDFPTDHIGSEKDLFPDDEPTEPYDDAVDSEDEYEFPKYPDESDDVYPPPTVKRPSDSYQAPLIPTGVKVTAVASLPFILGGIALVLFIGFLVWAFQTHEVTGNVTESKWTHHTTVWSWQDTSVRNWRHRTSNVNEIKPTNGKGERAGMNLVPGTCRQEHYDDERYQCGTHRECRDVYRTEQESYSCSKSERYACGETCRDNGNGFATCSTKYCTRSVPDTCTRSVRVFSHKDCWDEPDYCTRPIYKSRCTYKTQHWVKEDVLTEGSSGFDTTWVRPDLNPLQKETFSGKWTVKISYEDWGKDHVYPLTLKNEAEYKKYDVPKAKLTINNLGGVHSVEPLR